MLLILNSQATQILRAAAIAGILTCLGVFFAIPAVIYGHLGRARIRRSHGTLGGGDLAGAGIGLGYALPKEPTTARWSARLQPVVCRNTEADGSTALMACASAGDRVIIKLLLDHCAQINAANQKGWTALLEAAQAGKVAAAQLLLKRSRTNSLFAR